MTSKKNCWTPRDLLKQGRKLIKESLFKNYNKTGEKYSYHRKYKVFLLTDILVWCTRKNLEFVKVNYLEDLTVQSIDIDKKPAFVIISTNSKPMYICPKIPEEKQFWLDTLSAPLESPIFDTSTGKKSLKRRSFDEFLVDKKELKKRNEIFSSLRLKSSSDLQKDDSPRGSPKPLRLKPDGEFLRNSSEKENKEKDKKEQKNEEDKGFIRTTLRKVKTGESFKSLFEKAPSDSGGSEEEKSQEEKSPEPKDEKSKEKQDEKTKDKKDNQWTSSLRKLKRGSTIDGGTSFFKTLNETNSKDSIEKK